MNGNGSNSTVVTVATNTTAVISPGSISLQALSRITFNVAAGTVNGGATPGVDLLVSSVVLDYNGPIPVTKTGVGVMALDANNTFHGSMTISNGTLQLGTTSDTASLTEPLGMAPVTNNATLSFASSQSVTVTNVITGTGNLLVSSGTNTLTAANTYSGNTTISAGILALTGSGSIGKSANLSIAAGATFDVSAITTYLFSNTTLGAKGTGTTVGSTAAAIKGGTTVSLRTNPVVLAFSPIGFNGDTTHPAFLVSQGALTITNSAITVSNVSGTALGAGTYRLIQVTSGTLNGPSNSTVNVTGNGIVSGSTASLSASSGSLNLVVSPVTTATLLTRTAGNSPSTYGGNLTFQAIVSPDPGNGSTITFCTNGVAFGAATTTGGAANLTPAANVLEYSGGSAYAVTAVFGGSANYASSSGTLNGGQQVNQATVSASSGLTANNRVYNATTNATISSNNVVLAGVLAGDTANVSLSTNGYTASFATAAVGTNKTVTVGGLTLTGSAVANYTLTQPSLSANITAATVTMAVSSSANPSPSGSNLTFTTTLTAVPPGSGTPTGTAQFLADGTMLGAPMTLGGGVASLLTNSLSRGTYTITAQYGGDANFFGSTNSLSPKQVIDTPPGAGNGTIYRNPVLSVQVRLSTLLTNASDDYGDTLNITVSSTTASNATVAVIGGWVFDTPPVGFTNADSFSYTVTDSMGISATGTVAVAIQADNSISQNLVITNLGSGSFLVSGSGIPVYTYRLQYSDTSNPFVWQDIESATADSTGKFSYTDTSGSPTRFYRTVYP